MLFEDHLVVVRGGGDLATGTIYRLHRAGFPVLVLELQKPDDQTRAEIPQGKNAEQGAPSKSQQDIQEE